MNSNEAKLKRLYDFYVFSLALLTKADDEIDLREKIQTKAFIQKEVHSKYQEEYYQKYLDLLESGFNKEDYDKLIEEIKTNGVLTYSKKRRFIYNLAQIAQSKGQLSKTDYKEIIFIAGKMGIDEVSTHNIIDSVFSITNTFIAIIGVVCIGASLYFARALMIPLCLGYFLSRLIIKEQELLARLFFRTDSTVITKIISMIFTFVLIFYIFLIGFQAIYEMGSQLPEYWEKLNSMIERIDSRIQNLITGEGESIENETESDIADAEDFPRPVDSKDLDDKDIHHHPEEKEFEYQILEGISKFKEGITYYDFSLKNFLPSIDTLPIGAIVSTFVGSLFNFLAFLLLIFLFAAYLVFSDIKFTGIMLEMDKSITTYVATKFLISLITGILFYIVGISFNLDFPFLWGFLAFLLNFIPSIGSVIATIPPILIALLTFPFSRVLLMAIVLIVIQNIMGYIIEPLFMGRTMMLNPVAVLAGLILWGVLWGIPGMFMSAPLMALIKLVAENYSFSKNYTKYL